MKKGLILVAFVILAICLSLSSCGHECEYKIEWSKDATHHWHDCADKECELVSDIAEHTWNNGIITVLPTETTEGTKILTCTVCGEMKHETIAKCVYSSDLSKNDTHHWYACTIHADCGSKGDYVKHSWNSGTLTVSPTEATEGEKTFICADCGYIKTENIGKCAYNSKWAKTDTHHWRVCKEHSDCGNTVGYEEHNWNEGAITTFPTETKNGVKTYTCEDCGHTRKETLAKCILKAEWSSDDTHHRRICTVHTDCNSGGTYGEHYWEELITVPATETTVGTISFTCTVCSATKTDIIAKCVYSTEWSVDGTHHWHDCTSSEYCENKADYVEHSWNDGVVTDSTTEYTDGTRVYSCEICGYTKTEIIRRPLTEADWNAAFEASNFRNFHWNETGVSSVYGVPFHIVIDYKFTEDKAYYRKEGGSNINEELVTDKLVADNYRESVIALLDGVVNYADYDYDIETGTYKVNKIVNVEGVDTDDVTLRFDTFGRLIEVVYTATIYDTGLRYDISSVITIEYGNVVL